MNYELRTRRRSKNFPWFFFFSVVVHRNFKWNNWNAYDKIIDSVKNALRYLRISTSFGGIYYKYISWQNVKWMSAWRANDWRQKSFDGLTTPDSRRPVLWRYGWCWFNVLVWCFTAQRMYGLDWHYIIFFFLVFCFCCWSLLCGISVAVPPFEVGVYCIYGWLVASVSTTNVQIYELFFVSFFGLAINFPKMF